MKQGDEKKEVRTKEKKEERRRERGRREEGRRTNTYQYVTTLKHMGNYKITKVSRGASRSSFFFFFFFFFFFVFCHVEQ